MRTALRYWQETAHPLCHLSNLRRHDPRVRRHRGLDSEVLRNVRVREKVRLEIASLIEAPAAHLTLVRRLLHMHDFMNRQSPTLAKPFAALVTFERLLLAVYISMISQMILPAESLPAYVTRVWSLVGVGPFVNQQVVALRKLSIAELADKLFLGSLTRRSAGEERRRLRRRWYRKHGARMTLIVLQIRTLGAATPERQQGRVL